MNVKDGSKVWGAYSKALSPKNPLRHYTCGKDYPLPAPYRKKVEGAEERHILLAVRRVLSLLKIWHCRMEGGGKLVSNGAHKVLVPSEMSGFPDVLAIRDGRAIGLELKKPGGHVTARQYQFLCELQKAGAIVAIVVDPLKLEEFLETGRFEATLEGIPVV